MEEAPHPFPITFHHRIHRWLIVWLYAFSLGAVYLIFQAPKNNYIAKYGIFFIYCVPLLAIESLLVVLVWGGHKRKPFYNTLLTGGIFLITLGLYYLFYKFHAEIK